MGMSWSEGSGGGGFRARGWCQGGRGRPLASSRALGSRFRGNDGGQNDGGGAGVMGGGARGRPLAAAPALGSRFRGNDGGGRERRRGRRRALVLSGFLPAQERLGSRWGSRHGLGVGSPRPARRPFILRFPSARTVACPAPGYRPLIGVRGMLRGNDGGRAGVMGGGARGRPLSSARALGSRFRGNDEGGGNDGGGAGVLGGGVRGRPLASARALGSRFRGNDGGGRRRALVLSGFLPAQERRGSGWGRDTGWEWGAPAPPLDTGFRRYGEREGRGLDWCGWGRVEAGWGCGHNGAGWSVE